MQLWHAEFPYLTKQPGKQPGLVYLDNAASCQQPQAVLDSYVNYVINHHANAHRGSHERSRSATSAYESARETVAQFIGCAAENLALLPSTTQALNQLAETLPIDWQAGDEVILSAAEHHANILPWQRLAEQHQLKLIFLPVDKVSGLIQLDKTKLSNRTKVVALTLASNVTGIVQPLAEYFASARSHGAVCVVDAAQAAAHIPIQVEQLHCDALVFSAHKIYGPTGIAACYLRADLWRQMEPLLVGGGMVTKVTMTSRDYVDTIHKLEAGTPNVAAAVGFAAAVHWLSDARQQGAGDYLSDLHRWFTAELVKRQWLQLLPADSTHVPIVSCYSPAMHSYDLALLLDDQQIAVRAGEHCAQPLLQHWRLPGVLRFSLGLSNTREQLEHALVALDQAASMLLDNLGDEGEKS